jgi:hypothetical protein
MSNIQKYMDTALGVLQKFGIAPRDEESELVALLDDVKHVDEGKVMAIAGIVQYMSTYNEFVREQICEMDIGQRFNDITQSFVSIRKDAKTLADYLADGKIDWKEKISLKWMSMTKGSINDRFTDIAGIFKKVMSDSRSQLESEKQILAGYQQFRFAVKEAENLSYDVKEKQKTILEDAHKKFKDAVSAVGEAYATSAPESELSYLELERDIARYPYDTENKRYQLISDIAENLRVGYNVGEALMGKLNQTHAVKEQVYKKGVSFFGTNEHVITYLSAVYTSQKGLDESTRAVDAMTTGINDALEDIASTGDTTLKAGIEAGYGKTIDAAAVQKLVDSIVDLEQYSSQRIAQLREETEANAREIGRIVQDGQRRYVEVINRYQG